MQTPLKKFIYDNDRNLTELKTICNKCGSARIKKTFEYLRFFFYHTAVHKHYAEYAPEIAYCVACLGKDKVRLIDIAVSQEYQKKGIGKFLMNRLIETAKSKNLNKITLRTSTNETAFMFYQKLGFKDCGLNGEDMEMELELS